MSCSAKPAILSKTRAKSRVTNPRAWSWAPRPLRLLLLLLLPLQLQRLSGRSVRVLPLPLPRLLPRLLPRPLPEPSRTTMTKGWPSRPQRLPRLLLQRLPRRQQQLRLLRQRLMLD